MPEVHRGLRGLRRTGQIGPLAALHIQGPAWDASGVQDRLPIIILESNAIDGIQELSPEMDMADTKIPCAV